MPDGVPKNAAPSSVDGPILRTDRLTREVRGRRLVDDISIGVYKGDVLAVAGPSGSGKTSFLRMLNRLDEPASGTVFFEGKDYRQIPPRELRRRIGMVTQTPYLFPGTVAENLRFGPRQHGEELPGDAAAQLLREVGLDKYAQHSVHHLSGGEAQRVALARALANSPSVLLLDEPTSALDEGSKREAEALILSIVRQNALTCVLVTHDLAQAARMANRVMLVEGGRMLKNGLTQEVLGAQRAH
jgi:putative ABC transport system ATP-binding protein